MSQSPEDIGPRADLDLLLRHWRVPVALGILGSLAGLALSLLLAPRYEARAVLLVNLVPPAAVPFSDAQSDYLLNAAASLLSAPDLLAEVLASSPDLQAGDLRLERRENEWDLVASTADPGMAAQAANMWLEKGHAALADALAHALEAERLAAEMAILQTCPADPSQPPCAALSDPAALDAVLADLSRRFGEEQAASRGLSSALTVFSGAPAEVPEQALIRGRAALMLAGMGLGLLLALPLLGWLPGRRK